MTHIIPEGTDVKVHMNLHKRDHGHRDQWSVCDWKSGKLLATVETFTLLNAQPVDPSGSKGGTNKKYEDILKDGKRRVVADIRGTVTYEPIPLPLFHVYEEVHYDPKRCKYFTYQDGTKYEGSNVAHFPFNTSYFVAL